MKKILAIISSASALLLISPLSGATLFLGDIIGIDAGPTSTTNWMNWNPASSDLTTTFAAGSVTNLSGTTMDGIALTLARSSIGFSNTDGANNWAGLQSVGGSAPSVFVDSVTTDILGYAVAGGNITISFSGLNDAFTYRVVAVTSTNSTDGPTDRVTVGGSVSELNRGSAGTAGSFAGNFHDLTGLSSTSGDLVIAFTNPNGNNPLFNGAILEVTAIPEPGTYGAVAGLAALSLCLLRRRRR